MNTTQLMTDLARQEIRLEAHGDRLRFFPRSAVTPDLVARMKTHKAELLEALQRPADAPVVDDNDETIDALELGPNGWPLDCIDPAKQTPCPKCGTLELWQSLLGNWRCMRCDAPRKIRQTRRR